MKNLFTHLILFSLVIAGYWILKIALTPWLPYAEIFSFTLVIVIFYFINAPARNLINQFISKEYYFKLDQTQKALNELNDKLNSAIRYHELTKALSETFNTIFYLIPHAFYVLENNKYYLLHYNYIEKDSDILVTDLRQDFFSKVPDDTLVLWGYQETNLPETITKQLKEAKLVSILPFPGHSHIFALLLIDYGQIPFLKDATTKQIFQKIQKKAGLILENSALFLDLERKNYETKKIIEVSQKILSSLDTKNILAFILDSLRSLIQFDAASIFLLDESGTNLLNATSLGYGQSDIRKLHLKVGQGACGWVVKTKETDVLDDVRGAEHYYELRPSTLSQISIPLIFDRRVVGVLCVESDRVAYFDEHLVEVLQLFSYLAAIAIHNAQQFEVMLAKQALEHEIINASIVQKRLLVHQFPRFDNMHITAINIPSKMMSGDLYDAIKFNDHSLGLAIGDVSGKGIPAALMMTVILAGLRSQTKNFATACDIVYRLNNLLFESTSQGKYASFFFAVLLPKENKLIYTNAGHNPPLLVKADGRIIPLKKGGIVLGFLSDYEYHQAEVEFTTGDTLIAYTDGVTEAMNNKNEEFGEDRLIQLIKKNWQKSIYELKEEIIKAIQKYTNYSNPADDITIIISRHS